MEPVFPSFLTSTQTQGHHDSFEDYALKVGRVTAVYPPNDPQNANRQFTEYDVSALVSQGAGPATESTYYRCIVMSVFGGIADYSRWTPRVSLKNNQDGTFTPGSRVLIACLNGNQRVTYIVGGIPNPNGALNEEKTLESPYNVSEFNGVNFRITSDGSYTITRKGPTDDYGTVKDTTAGQSILAFRANGDIFIGQEKYNLLVGKSDESLIGKFNAIDFTATRTYNITANKFLINPLGSNQQQFLYGTSFRDNQKDMHNALVNRIVELTETLTAINAQIFTASSAFATAGTSCYIPVVGPIIAAPQFTAAGTALASIAASIVQAIVQLTEMYDAILTFEQPVASTTQFTDKYLSDQHSFSDTKE